MQKHVKILINEDGSTEIDLIEGFSGMSCVEKSKEIELLIGGAQIEQKQKPEYYEGGDVSVDLGIDLGM